MINQAKVKSFFDKIGLDWISILIILISLLVRIIWIVFTNHTFEDAFITFRYSQRLSNGFGFEYNLGQRTYGTTTPLFTFLLALWLFFSNNIILGARFFSLLSTVFSQYFLFRGLTYIRKSNYHIYPVMILVGLWPSLIRWDTGGMEMPIVILLIVISWYSFIKEEIKWTGILTGLLLLTRIDTFIWSLSLLTLTAINKHKLALLHVFLNVIIYLPWFLFALFYFGSPIPQTIVAKWFAYSIANQAKIIDQFPSILSKLGPATVRYHSDLLQTLIYGIAISIILIALYQLAKRKNHPSILVLLLFIVLEVARLVLTKATFTTRYLIPLLFVILVLAGLSIGDIFNGLSKSKLSGKLIAGISFSLFCTTLIFLGYREAVIVKDIQKFRHEHSLKAIGIWFNQNTPIGSKIQLEPLGYVGYYADRYMLDVVGLVTPKVIQMKQGGNNSNSRYIGELNPDYIVVHCDDVLSWIEDDDNIPFESFTYIESFNPLDFDPILPFDYESVSAQMARSACYEIWGK